MANPKTVKIPSKLTPKEAERLLRNFTAKLEKSTTLLPAPMLSVPEARIARAEKYAQRASKIKNPFVAQIFGDIGQFYREQTNNTRALGLTSCPPQSREVVKISRDEIKAIIGKYIQNPDLLYKQTNLIKNFLQHELQILQPAPTATKYKGARKDEEIFAKSDYIFADNDEKHLQGTETIKLFLKAYPRYSPSIPTF
jgi:hypothetical protein